MCKNSREMLWVKFMLSLIQYWLSNNNLSVFFGCYKNNLKHGTVFDIFAYLI